MQKTKKLFIFTLAVNFLIHINLTYTMDPASESIFNLFQQVEIGNNASKKKLLQIHPEHIWPHNGKTLLHYAAEYGCVQTIKLLLENKTPVNICDGDGETPLFYATFYGHKNAIFTLIAARAHIYNENKSPVLIPSLPPTLKKEMKNAYFQALTQAQASKDKKIADQAFIDLIKTYSFEACTDDPDSDSCEV